jgi:DNA-binding MarR family transcriptional regulator
MTRSVSPKRSPKPSRPAYVLEEQVGFILRQVWQRHATIFAREIGINLTPTQWAALAKLTETGPCSQNALGRLTAMDVATIKGVIDRLTARGLTETSPDPEDGRRLLVSLTRAGQLMAEKAAPNALAITRETLGRSMRRSGRRCWCCSASCADRLSHGRFNRVQPTSPDSGFRCRRDAVAMLRIRGYAAPCLTVRCEMCGRAGP